MHLNPKICKNMHEYVIFPKTPKYVKGCSIGFGFWGHGDPIQMDLDEFNMNAFFLACLLASF
jgi:hypothetical protein